MVRPIVSQALIRNNVNITGSGQPIVFAHGFGCDQSIWRYMAPRFTSDHTVVLYDLTGMGASRKQEYDRTRYASLDGHAQDLIEIVEEAGLRDVIFVGHSVSAIIGALAAIRRPELFDRLVMVCPSACYVNKGDYKGGFEPEDIEELIDTLDSNYLGWSKSMAPLIMGNPDRPELARELTNLFCQNDPEIARHFGRVTFESDNRDDLPKVPHPTLVIQSERDSIAAPSVGTYIADRLQDSRLVVVDTSGHCANLSAPGQTVDAVKTFLEETDVGPTE